MIKKFSAVILTAFCFSSSLKAQVPVREEPFHRPVLENKYIRLLDVWMKPGDTSLYHIHATPSLFLPLSNSTISSQIKGQEWVKEKFLTGKAWYRSFANDTLVHRVANSGTTNLHITDIEILSLYHSNPKEVKPMPFPLIFENEQTFAYELKRPEIKNEIISGCGPMVAQLATGDEVIFHDVLENRSKEIKTGRYLYIPAGAIFYFTAKGTKNLSLILFEIK